MSEIGTENKTEQNQENRESSRMTLGDLLATLDALDREKKRKKLIADILTLLGLGLLIYVIFAPQLYLRALAVGCFIAVSFLFEAYGLE